MTTPNGQLPASSGDVDGVLVVDKPPGPTSHDVVAVVRRALGVSRVGHTGTLDPLATGVLPLVVGRATRLARFLSASDKAYVADIRIGAVSETYDAEGPLTRTHPAAGCVELDRDGPERLDAALDAFRGSYQQLPPPHSAKKVGGTPAYTLARRKEPAELKPVSVTVHALDVLEVEGDLLRVRVVCSAGFYVRTLAHDLGRRLGVGAYLAALRRTRAGPFSIEESIPLDRIVSEGVGAATHLVPLDRLLPEMPAIVLAERGVQRVRHGNSVGPEHLAIDQQGAASGAGNSTVRLLDGSGALLAIAEWRPGGLLHPAIVLV